MKERDGLVELSASLRRTGDRKVHVTEAMMCLALDAGRRSGDYRERKDRRCEHLPTGLSR